MLNFTSYHAAFGLFLFGLLSLTLLGSAQQMDPTVRIMETNPVSHGARIRGFVAKDVWITCYVENLPADLKVRWQRTVFDKAGRETVVDISQDLDLQDNMKWSIEKPTPFSWRLRIKGLEVQDEGNYTCFVILTINNNRVMDNRTVFVTEKPLILEQFSSTDTSVQEGDNLPLVCNASGRPYPTIMWRREGNAILPGGGIVMMGSTLDIKNIQHDARGRYVCDAYNEVGKAKREILITITYSPKISPESARVGQKIGFPRMLVCLIDANPIPDPDKSQLYWSFNQQRLDGSDERHMVRLILGAYGRLTYELIVHPVTAADYGDYTCTARNVIGTTYSTIELYETEEEEFDRSWLLTSAASSTSTQSIIMMLIIFYSTIFII